MFVGSIAPTFTGCAYDMRATGHNTADNQGDIAGITGYQSPETITLDIGEPIRLVLTLLQNQFCKL